MIKSSLSPFAPSTHYGTFDTLQIVNDIKVPYENWGKGTNLEPITEYFGKNNPIARENYGVGGATQAITNTPITDYILKEIK